MKRIVWCKRAEPKAGMLLRCNREAPGEGPWTVVTVLPITAGMEGKNRPRMVERTRDREEEAVARTRRQLGDFIPATMGWYVSRCCEVGLEVEE